MEHYTIRCRRDGELIQETRVQVASAILVARKCEDEGCEAVEIVTPAGQAFTADEVLRMHVQTSAPSARGGSTIT